MADPIQVVESLDRLADHYAVFEPDQVLTHGQLNSVSDFLGDQLRLSRVALHGVGLVGGLHVAQAEGSVRVSRGLGVTTDGDLLMLAADTLYDRFRPYDESAPVYRPFYRGVGDNGQPTDMLRLHELVPAGESDVLARPLAELPGALADKAVLMLMETVVNDPDLCTGTDCDNLGRDALHRQRLLLIERTDAQALLQRLALRPASERAQALPALAARRPVLSRDIATTGALADRYLKAARSTLDDLLAALPALPKLLPEVMQQVFGGDRVPRWVAALREQAGRTAASPRGAQQWYAFVKDLVDTWNALREALLDDDAVTLPALAAFPKHLLLGALAAPREQRSGLQPSPLDAQARHASAHARFLAWKLDSLIAGFALPTDTALRVTPSVGADRPLEQRAIPWYYAPSQTQPVQVAWNFRLSARNQASHNLGYRAADWAEDAHVREPLAYAIDGFDFFRVEGHLGQQVGIVGDALRKLVAERNLPFGVQEVLLHNDRRRIVVRPPIRYTPLHTLHYLVRQDVAWRLKDGVDFGQSHVGEVTTAVQTSQVPAVTETGASVVSLASQAAEAVSTVNTRAAPLLASKSYSAYKAASGGEGGAQWKASYATSLESVSQVRANLGHVSRVDFTSPYDSLIISNQPHWIDWLDDLIQAQDERADDKLLFPRFVQDHPGLDHLGGAWRGGTFVLVYDDGGRVVGDFTLPYPAAEAQADEPDEPVLTLPPYRPPVAVAGGIRVVRPLDLKVADRVLIEREVFQKDVKSVLDAQKASIDGLVQGAFIPNNAVKATIGGKLGLPEVATGDLVLDNQARDMAYKRERVLELQQLLGQPTLDRESRVVVEADLAKAQTELAESVSSVAGGIVAKNVDVTGVVGAALGQQLTGSVALLQDPQAKAGLAQNLKATETKANAAQAVMLNNLRKVGGLG
jgi:hypothetical protein